MIPLFVFFWMMVILFGVIGGVRGWAKELMVTFSVILAIFLITVLLTYVAPLRVLLQPGGPVLFWTQTVITLGLVFFGYQTPNIRGLAGARFARERLADTLLGFFLGMINGYLIIGTLWYWYASNNYPFPNVIGPPVKGTPFGEAALALVSWLAPQYLTIPWVYFAVGLAFVFVIIVFI
jgi:hypothetical protein